MAKNDRTGGILLDVTDEAGTPTGNWMQLEKPESIREQIPAQIGVTGGATTKVTIEGRLGPGFPAVEVETVTDANKDILVDRWPQMRANVETNSGGAGTDIKVGIDARTRDTGA